MDDKPKGRVTVVDIASHAGVSTATVDRVLNRRPGVREKTSRLVLEAASALGYIDDSINRAAEIRPIGQISFILPEVRNPYIGMMGRLIVAKTAEFERLRLKPVVEHITSFNPQVLVKALKRHAAKADGIAFMAIDHPVVRETVAQLVEKGMPVVTLISDIAGTSRRAYFGLDNRAAGRLAGYLLGRFIGHEPAKVAMIAGSLSYRAHGDREMGFLDVLDELYPNIEVVGLREGRDDEKDNFQHTRDLLARHPDLKGIYNIGGAASGIGKALKYMRQERQVVFIGHGLTPDTRELLVDGTMDAVITQNAEETVLHAARFFSDLLAGQGGAVPEHMHLDVIFRENLPSMV